MPGVEREGGRERESERRRERRGQLLTENTSTSVAAMVAECAVSMSVSVRGCFPAAFCLLPKTEPRRKGGSSPRRVSVPSGSDAAAG